jgi:hypothetical protein
MVARALGFLAVILAAGAAQAQVIQLPSFSAVGVNTTVVVPDSGGVYLGGDRRVSSGLNTFGGIPRNRGWGIQRQAAGMGITARIHDPRAADAAQLGKFVRRPTTSNGPALAIDAGRAAHDAPLGSVAELKARRAQLAADQASAADRKVNELLMKARAAQAEGKMSVAAIYLRMAARQATGTLREEVASEMAALKQALSAAVVAESDAQSQPGTPSTRTARSND